MKKIIVGDAEKPLWDLGNISEYCQFYAIQPEDLKSDPKIAEYVNEQKNILESLITGYAEMASINREICEDFANCELGCDGTHCPHQLCPYHK